MKQFIYLDDDIVNSIIAQNEKGLIKETTSEKIEENNKKTANTTSTDISGGVEGRVSKFFEG